MLGRHSSDDPYTGSHRIEFYIGLRTKRVLNGWLPLIDSLICKTQAIITLIADYIADEGANFKNRIYQVNVLLNNRFASKPTTNAPYIPTQIHSMATETNIM